ncbi:unnamed protein product [Pseudo-nitzschia multistriata]|uniref:Uncharacterized protein n=1 Tax=Pseudo-nitzschia multistriata TaxID=183589 RepID=A0A448Z6U3_9STRA|nr:unnamed protein product [Pseudo-nitzschia multistriata]
MEEQLALGTPESYENALKIYSEGGNSKSVAEVTLAAPLTAAVPKGTPIMGTNSNGNQVAGKAYEDNAAGATTFAVQYQTSDSQKNYVGCQVGALVSTNTDGCFAASGTLSIDGTDAAYTYDIATDNVAKRSIAGFSTSAQKKMAECANCPYKFYEQFYNYYGAYDYANQIVLAAFAGNKANLNNFDNDYSLYGNAGNEQIIKKGTAYMVIWMYVIREMEDALDDCKEECTIENCNDDPVHAWDEAVAFYTGTLEGEDGSGSGKLAYALADKRCANFKTCGEFGDETTGTSSVNTMMFDLFNKGQALIKNGKCSEARPIKEQIEQLMLVPLIQGSLRYAWKQDNEDYSEKSEAEGAIFAASVLPIVARCNSSAAATIADNMKVGNQGTTDFAAVKKAFESTYDCMGIPGYMVGGLYDSATGDYYAGAEPVGGASSSSSVSTMVAAGVAAATSMFLFL